MKNSLLIGAILGVVTATAIYGSTGHNSMKKAKKAFIDKVEDILL